MSKKTMMILLTSIGITTIVLVFFGIKFDKSEAEKRNGLSQTFAVSSNDQIAYIVYHDGQANIYLKRDNQDEHAIELDANTTILDIDFSPDGTTLAYSMMDSELDGATESSVHIMDTRSFDTKELFASDGMITEITFDPKEEASLFYLQADTFEAYSPIAAAAPHEFDLHEYNLDDENHTQYTYLNAYSLNSLQVSTTEDIAYIQKDDDADADTAEDIFETNQRVFALPLDNPEELSIVSDPKREIDIFDFTIIPEEPVMIFQSISNLNAGSTFQYELYDYNWDSGEERKLTDLQSYATSPTLAADRRTVYFIVDDNFAGKTENNHLYKLELDTDTMTEIPLQSGD